jgi:hypothetical protein
VSKESDFFDEMGDYETGVLKVNHPKVLEKSQWARARGLNSFAATLGGTRLKQQLL